MKPLTPIIRALERRGVERYTLMVWRSRLLSWHHQAMLETIVVVMVLVLVLMFATAAVGFAQGAGEHGPPQKSGPPAATAMADMMATCQARHTARAVDVKALAKTVADARASRDVAVLHAALDAVAAHLAAVETHAAGCAEKMKGADHMKGTAPAAEPQQPHAH